MKCPRAKYKPVPTVLFIRYISFSTSIVGIKMARANKIKTEIKYNSRNCKRHSDVKWSLFYSILCVLASGCEMNLVKSWFSRDLKSFSSCWLEHCMRCFFHQKIDLLSTNHPTCETFLWINLKQSMLSYIGWIAIHVLDFNFFSKIIYVDLLNIQKLSPYCSCVFFYYCDS